MLIFQYSIGDAPVFHYFYVSSTCTAFNTPLEMPMSVRIDPFSNATIYFQYSIGDARPLRRWTGDLFIKCFQYSIGDAALYRVQRLTAFNFLSILHWRCGQYGLVDILTWPGIIFQYSIGDATLNWSGNAVRKKSPFNTPLEMLNLSALFPTIFR